MKAATTTKTKRKVSALEFYRSLGPFPSTALVCADPPADAVPSDTSLRVARHMVGALRSSGDRVMRLAAKLDVLQTLEADIPA